jgi:hypothetical protein
MNRMRWRHAYANRYHSSGGKLRTTPAAVLYVRLVQQQLKREAAERRARAR